jgi:hypothetical protein
MIGGLLIAAVVAGSLEDPARESTAPVDPAPVESPWEAPPGPGERSGPREGPTPRVTALALDVQAASPSQIARLVAVDRRFAALDRAQREALLEAIAIPAAGQFFGGLVNVFPGFGIGSLAMADLRGLFLTASDLIAWVLMYRGLDDVVLCWEDDCDPTPFNAGFGLYLAGRIAGVLLAADWQGWRHAAVSKALHHLPAPSPPESSLLVAPMVSSATGRAAPGATVVLRF